MTAQQMLGVQCPQCHHLSTLFVTLKWKPVVIPLRVLKLEGKELLPHMCCVHCGFEMWGHINTLGMLVFIRD